MRSIRLYHQDAERGLIRLMIWEKSTNDGLQMSLMKVKGNPLATTLTADLLNILNHAEEAASANLSVKYTSPHWKIIYNKERKPLYEEVLGLIRARDDVETTFESSLAGREIFELQSGEGFVVTAFDDPRSSKTDFQAARSGRLYILRFPSSIALGNRFNRANPGCLGMSLSTYRMSSIAEYFQRVKASNAQKIIEIVANEFGEQTFFFIAPDGYFWILIESAL